MKEHLKKLTTKVLLFVVFLFLADNPPIGSLQSNLPQIINYTNAQSN